MAKVRNEDTFLNVKKNLFRMNFSMLQEEYPLINLTKSDFEVDKLSDENELFMPSCFTGGKKWINCSNSNKKPQHFNNCNAVDHDKVC